MEKGAEQLLVNQKTFAALWGVSAGTVIAWINAGMPTEQRTNGQKGKRSGVVKQIDLYKALPWCKEHFNRAGQYASERDRKAAMEADLLELKLNRELQNLLDFDFMREALTAVVGELIRDLNAQPGLRCRKFAAEDSPAVIQALMQEDARELAETFSQSLDQLSEFSHDAARRLEAGETTPETDGG